MKEEIYITNGVGPNSLGTEKVIGERRGRTDGEEIDKSPSAYTFRIPVTPAIQRLRFRSRAEWAASTEDFAEERNGGSLAKEPITKDYQPYRYG